MKNKIYITAILLLITAVFAVCSTIKANDEEEHYSELANVRTWAYQPFDTKEGRLLSIVSGWAAESVFYDGTDPLSLSVTLERTRYLDIIHATGKPVLSVDYVDDGSGYSGANKERIDDYRTKAMEKGYIPYVAKSDMELDELNIIEGVQP